MVDFRWGAQGSHSDDIDVVSFSYFAGYVIKGVGMGIDFIYADAMDYDAEFWLSNHQSFVCHHPVNFSEPGCLFYRFTGESYVVAF